MHFLETWSKKIRTCLSPSKIKHRVATQKCNTVKLATNGKNIIQPHHEELILSKFDVVWRKIIDFQLVANFSECPILAWSPCRGPSIKDIRFFGPSFDLPTYPYPILSHCYDCFSKAISDFWKPNHLPKNRISFVDAPQNKFQFY